MCTKNIEINMCITNFKYRDIVQYTLRCKQYETILTEILKRKQKDR